MSSICSIQTDSRQLTNALSALSGKDISRVVRNSLKKAVRPLAKSTERRYDALFDRSGESSPRKRGGSQGIVRLVSRTQNGLIVVKVHIMRDYKAKWFELGTDKRYTKGHRNVGRYRLRQDSNRRYTLRAGRPGYRGRIRPKWIFTTEQRKQEHRIKAGIDQYLGEEITKLINRRIKS